MPEMIDDLQDSRIKNAVHEYGNSAEHNYHHFLNIGAIYKAKFFLLFEKKYGIMCFKDDDVMWCYSNPVAPAQKRQDIFLAFVKWAFKHGAGKIRSEISEDLWKDITESMDSRYRAVKPSFVYFWPVYSLHEWDPQMPGAAFKKFRNTKNYFLKNHAVEVVGKDQVSRKELFDLVDKWKKSRQGSDKIFDRQYISSIESDFAGYDSVRIICIDGAAKVLNGGWKIPNTKTFYSQLGIHDYSIDGMGEFSYIEDLESLKNMGFDFADFGGSTESMLNFKKKFMPAYVYKTVEFSIVKNYSETRK